MRQPIVGSERRVKKLIDASELAADQSPSPGKNTWEPFVSIARSNHSYSGERSYIWLGPIIEQEVARANVLLFSGGDVIFGMHTADWIQTAEIALIPANSNLSQATGKRY